jgi:hypothetical protein
MTFGSRVDLMDFVHHGIYGKIRRPANRLLMEIENMPRRPPKKKRLIAERTETAAELGKALQKQKKADLIDALLELARDDRGVLRQLTKRFEVRQTEEELLAATRRAIADATDFDEREINYNFDYDYDAYDEVKRNLGRLVEAGQLRSAMELSLELMKESSYQVEMSDEGLMTDDIEECLNVVFKAIKQSELRADEIITWCDAMAKADRVGFIANKQLASLRMHFKLAP